MVIEKFMSHYLREYDFYQELAHLCAQQCESMLESNGIRAIVTFRAKRPDRLQEKITKRNIGRNYQNVDSIDQDIADMAGVRIALYFPGDHTEVSRLIINQFGVKDVKEFPVAPPTQVIIGREKRFSGYWAKHYRVTLKDENLQGSYNRFTKAIIEIQVASVLMHAWSEVEHDLVYKPSNGELSEDECAILDQLNGLVLAGEIGLERLQIAFKSRIAKSNSPFGNVYELSAYLYGYIETKQKGDTDFKIGNVDILFEFLRKINLNTPDQLKPYLLKIIISRPRPVSYTLIDLILCGKKDFFYTYLDIVSKYGQKKSPIFFPKKLLSSEIRTAIHFFIDRLITFEYMMKIIFFNNTLTSFEKIIENVDILQFSTKDELKSLLVLRRKLIHINLYDLTSKVLVNAGCAVEKFIDNFYKKQSPDNQLLITASKTTWSVEPIEELPPHIDSFLETACAESKE